MTEVKLIPKEDTGLVKGVSRRVVVVQSPDPKLFEQAIFIVRGDAPPDGVSSEQIVREAAEVARRYMKGARHGRRLLSPWIYALLGAVSAAAVCLMIVL